MSFSAEWLALREPVDHRSRDSGLGKQVSAHFSGKPDVKVVDFGCGTGSNLRATSALLPNRQEWVLVDYDPALLSAAKSTLSAWADRASEVPGGIVLEKGAQRIIVTFRQVDLARDLESALGYDVELVTASALFDLISTRWIDSFCNIVSKRGAAFYTVLTYDGTDAFTPPHSADRAVIEAFAAHQAGDKGFGPAAGPGAADALAKGFAAVGYGVSEADSPWHIGSGDRTLAMPLLEGMAAAVAETGRVPARTLADWLSFRQAAMATAGGSILTGHRDTFARPGPGRAQTLPP